MNKEEGDEFLRSQLHFKQQIINSFSGKVRLTLTEPKNLMCMMRVGASRQVLIAGDEEFHLTTAMIVEDGIRKRHMKLRIEPVKRQEYRFSDLLMSELDGFTGKLMTDPKKPARVCDSWDDLYEWMLDQPCPEQPSCTYRELVVAAEAAERNRIFNQNLSSQAEFGTW